MNKPKQKGTAFETACARWMQRRLDDDRIERRALHGSNDMGDLYGIWAHGYHGIAECKDYKSWSDADLARWLNETVAEKDNADADFALLIVHRSGCGESRFGKNLVWLTVGDLMRISGNYPHDIDLDTRSEYVCVTLEAACRMIGGYDEQA